MASSVRLPVEVYTVGWIAALDKELAAAKAVLDEIHQKPEGFRKHAKDSNNYVWGNIGGHNIAIVSLPAGRYGNVSAASTAWSMMSSLPHLRFGLLVGIGAGVPRLAEDVDIRLGDVVVSQPTGASSGVIQYDFGKLRVGGRFDRVGSLNSPPDVLLKGLATLKANHLMEDSQMPQILEDMMNRYPKLAKSGFLHQGSDNDKLFDTDTPSSEVPRIPRPNQHPEIHYGIIASGNAVVKCEVSRDDILRRLDEKVICFEMEAAGLMNDFPCLVFRGICDYADGHKDDRWQNYAAATAAALAKEFLSSLDEDDVERSSTFQDAVKELRDQISNISICTEKTNEMAEKLVLDRQTENINRWLNPPDPSINYNKAREQYHRGSGQWFIQSTQFAIWLQEGKSFLWLHGIPGCGKTILSSTIVAHLEQNERFCSGILYFYFDFKDKRKQSFEEAVKSLTVQLYNKKEQTRSRLDMLYADFQQGKQQPGIDLLCKVLRSMIQDANGTWIILDALDECSAPGNWYHQHLLSWMRSILQEPSIHLLVTSRPEQDIEAAIMEFAGDKQIIPLQSQLVHEDICAYIKNRIVQDRGLKRWNAQPAVKQQIEGILVEKAKGMFRWVSCQLDALDTCYNYPSLQKALASLPQTLDETYARILEKINQQHTQGFVQLLQFLIYSDEPLKLSSAIDIMAVDLDKDPRFNLENRLPEPREILRVCSSLITLVTKRSSFRKRKQSTVLQLSHFSVKEYLISDRVPGSLRAVLNETAARASMAKICLAYLMDIDHSIVTGVPSFVIHSACEWAENARVSESEDRTVSEMVLEFFARKENSEFCFEAIKHLLCHHPYSEGRDYKRSPLHFASHAGLFRTVRAMLVGATDCNEIECLEYGYASTAIAAAARGGHENIVRELIRQGANVNIDPQSMVSAIASAARGGHLNLVKFLFEQGADLDAIDSGGWNFGDYGGNALQCALQHEHPDIARFLLDNGAEPDGVRSHLYGYPLRMAAEYQERGLFRLLLDKGADFKNTKGYECGAAVLASMYDGSKANFSCALSEWFSNVDAANEADIEGSADIDKTSALQMALLDDEEAVIILLQEGGLDITAALTNLQHPAPTITRLFVDCGADVNAQGGEYGNALQHAAYQKEEETVVFLLQMGANVNAEGGRYGNALQAASCSLVPSQDDGTRIAQILLDAGAEVNAQGGEFGNALRAAAYHCNPGCIHLLLESGASLEPPMTEQDAAPEMRCGGDLTLLWCSRQELRSKLEINFPGTTFLWQSVYGGGGTEGTDVSDVEHLRGLSKELVEQLETVPQTKVKRRMTGSSDDHTDQKRQKPSAENENEIAAVTDRSSLNDQWDSTP